MSFTSNYGNKPLVVGRVTMDKLVAEDATIVKFIVEGDLIADNITVTGNVTTTGGISGASLDTGQGANELFLMDQDVKTTDAVTFASVNTGQGANELYAMNQSLLTTDDVTFASIDTGQGANELYAMNQDVTTTDSVLFDSVRTDELSAGTTSDADAIITTASTTQGVLLTRQTTAQRESIGGGSPPAGLLTFDTDVGTYYTYSDNDFQWEPFSNPETKASAVLFTNPSTTVPNNSIQIVTTYDGSSILSQITFDGSTGEIFLPGGRVYMLEVDALLQGFAVNNAEFTLRVINDNNATIGTVTCRKNSAIRTDCTVNPVELIDTRSDTANEIIRIAWQTVSGFSVNSNFSRYYIYEL